MATCPSPVLVVGAPGSGSEVVHAALAAHPRFWGAEQGDFLAALLADLDRIYEAGSSRGRLHWLSGQQVTAGELAAHLGLGANALYASRAGAARWVDHTPAAARHLPRLAAMFPEARIVSVLRDGRECVAAMTASVPGLPHRSACHIWRRYAEAYERAVGQLPADRFRAVRIERLLVEPEAELTGLLAFLEEAPDPASSAALAAGRLPAGRWDGWGEEARAAFGDEAGEALERLGYVRDRAPA